MMNGEIYKKGLLTINHRNNNNKRKAQFLLHRESVVAQTSKQSYVSVSCKYFHEATCR